MTLPTSPPPAPILPPPPQPRPHPCPLCGRVECADEVEAYLAAALRGKPSE
jgi:hypothetical protein